MSFEEALKAMKDGKKVKHKTSKLPILLTNFSNGYGDTFKAFCVEYENKHLYYPMTLSDILAEDWEVVDE